MVKLGGVLHGWAWPMISILLLLLCLKKKFVLSIIAVTVCGMIFGIWRGTLEADQLDGYNNYLQQKVAVSGEVVEDPTYDDKGMLDFRLQNVQVGEQNLPGEVRVKTYSFIEPRRGDSLVATGKLLEGFGNYQAAMYYAEAEVVAKNESVVDVIRREFAASVLTNMPDPQASLGLGFLIGLKSGLPSELDDQMRLLGLTHIVVASGYNLTILIRLARRLFEKVSKYQTAIVSAGLIIGFVAVTGFSPSMSRAALVTGLALAAWYYGRRIHPITLLLFAAAVTTALNPLFLWGDLGWWLSFLAFAGVLVLAPMLQKRLFGDKQPKLLGQIVLETLCAQLLTLPLILFVFGNLSVLSLLANILVVPLVPLAMLCTFIGGLTGLILPALAPIVSVPAVLILSFITEVVGLLAQIPWASVPLSIAWPVMLGFYATIFAIGFIVYKRVRFNFLRTSVVE
jgi:competence protein ComEC